METLNEQKEKILVIQTAFIGDAILTLPMLGKLKQRNSQTEIDVLAIPSTEEIFVASEYVDRVIVVDKRGKHKGFRALGRFIKELKKSNYTRVYSPHRSFRSAYITLKLDVKESYGFDNSSLMYAYKKLVKYNQQYHEVQRNLELIGENTQSDSWKIKPKIVFNNLVKKNVNDLMSSQSIDKNFIAIAPGSVWETKRYPKEYIRDLIEILTKKNEIVVLIGGKEDNKLCDDIASDTRENVINFAGEFSVVETICFLQNAKLLITNDSAPTHFGMCADIPVLTIYCSTVPEFGFYPYNDRSRFVSFEDLDCKPCGIHGYEKCPISTFECGKNLSVQTILSEVKKMLKSYG